VAGLGAGLAIIFMLVAWQLSKGPISLGFLSPYIEDAVNAERTDLRLRMRDTILTWAGWERTLDIRVLGMEVLDRDGAVVGSVPEVAFALSGEALFAGEVAPENIELFGPRLRVQRNTDGRFDVGLGDQPGSDDVLILGLLDKVLKSAETTDNKHPLRYLRRLDILGADVVVDDRMLDTSWHAPSADLRLTRDAIGIQGRMSLVLDVEGKQTELEILGRYRAADKRIDITADIDKIQLAPFAPAFADIAPLRILRLPLQGRVALSLDMEGRPESVSFDVTGGAGDLNLPDIFGEPIRVDHVAFRGRHAADTNATEIEELNVHLGPNWNVPLPAPVNHRMPLRSFTLKGRFEGSAGRFEMDEFKADLNGPTVLATGLISGLPHGGADGTPIADIRGELHNVPVSDIPRYWPAALGSDAHSWVATHMADGTMEKATATVRLGVAEDGALTIEKINGDMRVRGTTVDYLSPMPPVRKVDADIVFDREAFRIKILRGVSETFQVRSGQIDLTGLDQYDQYADITLNITGDLKKKLFYVDNEPLGYVSSLGIDPKSVSGTAETDLKLHFILEKSLTLDQVDVTAISTLNGVALEDVFLDRGIHDGVADLKVDKDGMTLTGDVKFATIPAKLVWRENFGEKRPYRSRYDLSAVIDDVRRIEDLGLDMEPFSEDYVSGKVGASIRFTVFDDVDRKLEVMADITDASLAAPAFGWEKKTGVRGRADVVLLMERDDVVDIPRFSVKAADLIVTGSAKYAAGAEGLRRIDFDRVSFGRTNLAGALIPKEDGGWEAGFHGPSFDLSPLWDEILSGDSQDTSGEFMLPRLTLVIEMDRVWLTETESFSNVSGTFAYRDDYWHTVLLDSTINERTAFKLTIQPGQDGNRIFRLKSDNAGDTLRLLDLYENMVGGSLEVAGGYDDAAPGRPLSGRFTVSDYRVVGAPVLARVVSYMSLTGILEALEGDGLAFNSLEVPFSMHEGTLELDNAKATGTSLGFTASGNVYTHADVLDLEGTVIPAYALNSVFGNIPVLGEILTGGEEGGGVFAANYTMTGSVAEPEVSVNPLTALAPGILRNVFGVFDKAAENLNTGGVKKQTIVTP